MVFGAYDGTIIPQGDFTVNSKKLWVKVQGLGLKGFVWGDPPHLTSSLSA